MYYKTLFPFILLLLVGCALIPKTEVRETPRSKKVVFYSDDSKANAIGCVNIYKLMTESLAARGTEKILKGFIAEGSSTLDRLRNEIDVLQVLAKLQNKIEEIADTGKEGKESEKMKRLKENYPQLYPKLKRELLEGTFPAKDEKMKQIKEDYLKFYRQFSLNLQELNYDLLKELQEETVSIINRLGRKGNFKKIIDSSNGNTANCQLDMTEEFMHIYDKMVENNYQDFRFHPCSKEKIWEVLIAFLESADYTFQTLDEENGIVKTQPVHFNLNERSTVTNALSKLREKDSAQLTVNEYIDLIAHAPAGKKRAWLISKESLTIQVIPFSQTLTKIKMKIAIEAFDDSEGWQVLISKKFAERSIFHAIEKELLAKQYLS